MPVLFMQLHVSKEQTVVKDCSWRGTNLRPVCLLTGYATAHNLLQVMGPRPSSWAKGRQECMASSDASVLGFPRTRLTARRSKKGTTGYSLRRPTDRVFNILGSFFPWSDLRLSPVVVVVRPSVGPGGQAIELLKNILHILHIKGTC